MNPAETIKDWAQRSKQFYAETRNEMKKVSWPGRDEVVGTTVVVIVAVAFFGFYLFLVDSAILLGLGKIFAYFGASGG